MSKISWLLAFAVLSVITFGISNQPGPEHAPMIGSFAMPLVVILHNIEKPVEEVIKSSKTIYR